MNHFRPLSVLLFLHSPIGFNMGIGLEVMKSRFEAQIRASEAESIFVSRSIKSSHLTRPAPAPALARFAAPSRPAPIRLEEKCSVGMSEIIFSGVGDNNINNNNNNNNIDVVVNKQLN